MISTPDGKPAGQPNIVGANGQLPIATPGDLNKRFITAQEMDIYINQFNSALTNFQRSINSLGIRTETISQILFDSDPKFKFHFEDEVLELSRETFEEVVKRVIAEMKAKVKEIEEREAAKKAEQGGSTPK